MVDKFLVDVRKILHPQGIVKSIIRRKLKGLGRVGTSSGSSTLGQDSTNKGAIDSPSG